MLRPVRMRKVRLICIKSVASNLIKELHQLSVVHIKDAELPQTFKTGPLATYDEISSRLIRIRSLKEMLQNVYHIQPPKKKITFEKLIKQADELLGQESTLQEILQQQQQALEQLEAISASKHALSDIANLNVDFSELYSESLQFVLLKATKEQASRLVKLFSERQNCQLLSAPCKDGHEIVLVALQKSDDPRFLEKFGSLLQLPQIEGRPAQQLKQLEQKENEVKKALEQANTKLAKFAQKYGPLLIAAQEALEIEADRARIASFFSATDTLYIIEGWVEKKKMDLLKTKIEEKFGKKVLITEAKVDEHHETPPTLLSNPKPIRPFQFIVEFLSTTHYNEIDPSPLLALFIPILYAMILGDAGYAIISFMLSSYLVIISKRGSLLRQVSRIWQISSIPAFLFGAAFDEWFGFTHAAFFEKIGFGKVSFYSALLHRVHQIETLILLVIIVGAIHLGIGFLLGAINEFGHSRKHAIAKLAWLGIEIGGFFSVAGLMFGTFPELTAPALALLVISATVMILSEGFIGAFEIPGLASNIMSYIRIAAVGVGGVILAEAINELLFPKWDFSLGGIIAFVIGMVAYLGVHLLSCIIAMFESFIHGTRLNVVEFFGKFYKGNGIKFSPFSLTRLYSREI
ncbi:MAG: V-type ATP synthase subunit I [Candidatus Anstonellaceae archaeon]